MKYYVCPYKLGSESAKLLAEGLMAKRTEGNKKFFKHSCLINWGKSSLSPSGRVVRIINTPQAVALAANKLNTFKHLMFIGVNVPDFTTDRELATQWVQSGHVVYGRATATGSEGRGIIILTEDSDNIPSLPLYTKGITKGYEYRVHVAFGRVIDYTKKRRRSDVETNEYIKNYNNGWVFCREGVDLPAKVKQAALLSVVGLGLDFGALDIVYREREDKAYVLEINTAPGIEGTTLTKYIETFRRELGYGY